MKTGSICIANFPKGNGEFYRTHVVVIGKVNKQLLVCPYTYKSSIFSLRNLYLNKTILTYGGRWIEEISMISEENKKELVNHIKSLINNNKLFYQNYSKVQKPRIRDIRVTPTKTQIKYANKIIPWTGVGYIPSGCSHSCGKKSGGVKG